MKLSTTTAIYRDRPEGKGKIPVIECVRRLHQAGYRDVDINFNLMSKMDLELSKPDWQDWARELGEVLGELGMTALQCHVPFYNVLEPDSIPNAEYTEEIIRRAVAAAGNAGIRTAVFHGGSYEGTCDPERNLKGNLEYFKPYAELAGKYGVSVAIENLPGTKRAGGDKDTCTSCPEQLLELCGRLRKEYGNVGVCWDFGHGNLTGCDQARVIEELGDYLLAVHVSDNYGIGDDHNLPYQGNIPWKQVMQALGKAGYQGAFAYETHKLTAAMPEEMVDETLRYTYRLGTYLMSLAE